MQTLIAEYFSPWSEKARWALDHHALPYAYREHVPLLGEVSLRLRTRRIKERASTPTLITDEGVIHDSFAIARHADAIGRGPKLFTPQHNEAITAWNARSEATLFAGRALYLERLVRDPAAKLDMQPREFPEWLRRVSAPATDLAVAFVRHKYGIDTAELEKAEATLARELEGLRVALDGGRAYLLGDALTYADIAMAVTLQFVAPVDPKYIPIGPASQRAWGHPVLAKQYSDLVAWRDTLYGKHRLGARTQ